MKIKFKKLLVKLAEKIPASWKEAFSQFKHDVKFEVKRNGLLSFVAEIIAVPAFLLIIWVLLILLNGMQL